MINRDKFLRMKENIFFSVYYWWNRETDKSRMNAFPPCFYLNNPNDAWR